MSEKRPTPTGTKLPEPIELETFRKTRDLRDLLTLPGMEACRKTYHAGDAVTCNPHTVIVTMTGSVMVWLKTQTDHGLRRSELRSYGRHRLPNYGALRGRGYPSEDFEMVAEGKRGEEIQVLEFDFRVHGDLLRACRDWFQDIFLDQHAEDLGQIKYLRDGDVRQVTDSEVSLSMQLAETNAKVAQLEEKFEKEADAHVLTRQNLDNTTRLLTKAGEANAALRKMTPDVLSMIEESNAKMRREAERFPLVLNAILEARGQRPATWEEIGPILKRLEENSVEIEVVEVEVDASSLRGPSLIPEPMSEPEPTDPNIGRTTAAWPVVRESAPDSQIVVSNGRRLGEEKVETHTGIADEEPIPLSSGPHSKHEAILGSTQAWGITDPNRLRPKKA